MFCLNGATLTTNQRANATSKVPNLLTSLLYSGRQHVLPCWQWHEEGEGDHPQADGEVGQHLGPNRKEQEQHEWKRDGKLEQYMLALDRL